MKRALPAAVVALGIAMPVPSTGAAELVMLHQPGCGWCLRFEEDIGQAYPNTTEGAIAPLRRVDITKTWPADLAGVTADRFTPTFVLVEDGQEVSRLRGYPGDQFFWFLLDEMIAKLPSGAAGLPEG